LARSNLMLYVDDVEVAKSESTITGTGAGLFFGTGKNMEPGTFWYGLIDDIRIYRQVIVP